MQDSSIIDFYPDDFAIDLNGKKYAWQGESVRPSLRLSVSTNLKLLPFTNKFRRRSAAFSFLSLSLTEPSL